MTRRKRILVPFEVGSFLRAPYGWPIAQRRRELGRAAPLTRRQRRSMNAGLAVGYLLLGAGAWLGVHLWHGVPGALGGLALALAVLVFAGFVVMLASGVRGIRRDPDGRPEGADRASLE